MLLELTGHDVKVPEEELVNQWAVLPDSRGQAALIESLRPIELFKASEKQLNRGVGCGKVCALPERVASVAQLVEQLTLNQLVLGSSPSRGTIFPSIRFCASGPKITGLDYGSRRI